MSAHQASEFPVVPVPPTERRANGDTFAYVWGVGGSIAISVITTALATYAGSSGDGLAWIALIGAWLVYMVPLAAAWAIAAKRS